MSGVLTWRRPRLQMLQAERAAVLTNRDAGQADHTVRRCVLAALEPPEAMLGGVSHREDGQACDGWQRTEL